MAQITENNFIKIIQDGLGDEIKKAVTDQLIKDELFRYEAKLRPVIEERVNKLCFKSIESMRDCITARDELHVFLHWEGSDEPITRDTGYSSSSRP